MIFYIKMDKRTYNKLCNLLEELIDRRDADGDDIKDVESFLRKIEKMDLVMPSMTSPRKKNNTQNSENSYTSPKKNKKMTEGKKDSFT